MSQETDWTAAAVNGDLDAGDDDNFSFGGAGVATTQTAEEIGAENSYRDMPIGEYPLVVTGYEAPKKVYYKVLVGATLVGDKWVGGQMTGYEGWNIVIFMAKADDLSCRTRDYFVGPPQEPDKMQAYLEGVATDAKPYPSARGFNAKKFDHFLGAMGFDWIKGQPRPSQALQPKNWKGRKVSAKIEEGRGTYTPKDKDGSPQRDANGQEVKRTRSPQIKMFSFTRVAGLSTPTIASTPRPQAAQQQQTSVNTI